jgi:hypothetical protein
MYFPSSQPLGIFAQWKHGAALTSTAHGNALPLKMLAESSGNPRRLENQWWLLRHGLHGLKNENLCGKKRPPTNFMVVLWLTYPKKKTCLMIEKGHG